VAEEDIYICPTGEKLTHHFTNEENGLVLHHYWINACRACALKFSARRDRNVASSGGRTSMLSMLCRRA